MIEPERMTREQVAELLHQAEASVVPGPPDPPVTSPHFPKRERERFLRMADAVLPAIRTEDVQT